MSWVAKGWHFILIRVIIWNFAALNQTLEQKVVGVSRRKNNRSFWDFLRCVVVENLHALRYEAGGLGGKITG
jgi:hypothetical protein